MIAQPEGRQIMRDRPNISSDLLNDLRGLRRGTLGREYVEWLDGGDVTPDTREPVRLLAIQGATLRLFIGPLCGFRDLGVYHAPLSSNP